MYLGGWVYVCVRLCVGTGVRIQTDFCGSTLDQVTEGLISQFVN